MDPEGFPDPESCALSGYSRRSNPHVVASARSGSHAVVLVVTPDGGGNAYLVNCVLEGDRWFDAGGGDATEQWGLIDEERDTGWLRGWGQVKAGTRSVRIEYAGTTVRAAVSDHGYYVWTMDNVPCPGPAPKVTELR